eukprot:3182142-Rhodomonas_salina.1
MPCTCLSLVRSMKGLDPLSGSAKMMSASARSEGGAGGRRRRADRGQARPGASTRRVGTWR